MKKIYTAMNPADAHLLKGLLEGEGIQAVVRGEFLWGVRGEVPIPETSPSVWVVEDADYDRAVELVSAFVRDGGMSRPDDGREWRCGGCGETNEAPFTECWKCGRSRPPA